MGTILYVGTIRITAGAGAATAAYSPISAGTLSGTGTLRSGPRRRLELDLAHAHRLRRFERFGRLGRHVRRASNQRLLITDAATGKSVGVSFASTTSSSTATLTVSLMDSVKLDLLQIFAGRATTDTLRLELCHHQLHGEFDAAGLCVDQCRRGSNSGCPGNLALRQRHMERVCGKRFDLRRHVCQFHGNEFQRLCHRRARARHAGTAAVGLIGCFAYAWRKAAIRR